MSIDQQQSPPTIDRLYSIEDAAVALGVGRTTAYALIRDGQLPVVRIGRRTTIRGADIQSVIDAHTSTVSNPRENERRDSLIRAAKSVGLTDSQIARAFGLTRQRIHQIVAVEVPA